MSSPPSDETFHCPECGALLAADADHCWMCRRELLPAGAAAEASPQPTDGAAEAGKTSAILGGGPPVAAEPRPPFQFGLSSLLLLVTLAAIVLSVSSMSLGLGIVLSILIIPAMLRTYVRSARSGARGQPLSPQTIVGLFAITLGITTIIVVAVAAAFFVACFAGVFASGAMGALSLDQPGWPLAIGGILGSAAALTMIVVLIRLFRRRPHKTNHSQP